MLGTLYWSAPLLGGLELDNDDYLWFSFLALCVSVSLFRQLACLSLFKNTPELHLIGKLLESLMQQFLLYQALAYVRLYMWAFSTEKPETHFERHSIMGILINTCQSNNISVDRTVFFNSIWLNIALYLVPSSSSTVPVALTKCRFRASVLKGLRLQKHQTAFMSASASLVKVFFMSHRQQAIYETAQLFFFNVSLSSQHSWMRKGCTHKHI